MVQTLTGSFDPEKADEKRYPYKKKDYSFSQLYPGAGWGNWCQGVTDGVGVGAMLEGGPLSTSLKT